ncbi:MAG: hypothetical protein HOW73_23110 [Polyangiaceae bacterium]|nr:hypothetical protein [Polyangiaceae bacterium]
MALYVAESYNYTIEHGGHVSMGVVGAGGGSEKIYLHVIPITDAEIAKLRARVDESGNKQHDRLALPDREDWWVAVDGEKTWPGSLSPKVRSKSSFDGSSAARPAALSEAELTELRRLKVKLPDAR